MKATGKKEGCESVINNIIPWRISVLNDTWEKVRMMECAKVVLRISVSTSTEMFK